MKSIRPSRPKQPTVVVIAGPNGAGKSTAAPYLLQQALAASKISFAFETTLSSRTFSLFLTRCKAEGYSVQIFYVALPSAELAVNRVALRVKLGEHNIPQADVERRFQRSLENLFEMYMPLADRWTVLDNASGTLKPIAHGTAHRTYVEESEKWLNLKRLAL